MAQDLGNGQTFAPPEVRRVIWTDEAVANLDAIVAYIEDFSPLAAQRMAIKLIGASESLSTFPDRGRSSLGATRELTIIRPYIIRYRTEADAVFILRIRHTARAPD